MRQLCLLVLAVCLLSACQQSPRKNYYAFSVAPAEQQDTTTNITDTIGIGPIDVAEYLNRLQLAYQTNDGRLVMPNNSYWAEPIDKGIVRALTLNLTQRDHTRSIVTFPWRSDSKPRYSLRLQVHGLDRDGNQAKINATWELVDNDNKSVIQRQHFIRSTEAKTGTRFLVQAYSQLLSELAVEMDNSLTALKEKS